MSQVPPIIKKRLRTLESRAAIEELRANYARRSDAVFNEPGNASAVALADLFTDDGVLDLGPFGKFEGRDALINAFENLLPQGTKWSTHYIVNPVIEVDGDAATGDWYYLIDSLPAGEGAQLVQFRGGYSDKYVRVDGEWRIKEALTRYFVPPSE
ncbi:hypothetical protein PPSIR1_13028 [Plesiocystis pacifica SIR-1]|uniref:SnoaL-like domain-containing protein n=1 Tax=Plesiocystis pacifica SIR-1 TaxID=391625 RepID=A6G0B0_9BACT|nr:nuclear transport factor 2 family protein [Plesiocystis pacifica]EDM80807.1 hypothetical protein PPSIR1_13028 [Plesiocystis pacifica SIR-1]